MVSTKPLPLQGTMPAVPTEPFRVFGPDHLGALAFTVVASIVCIFIGRSTPHSKADRMLGSTLAWVLLATYPMKLIVFAACDISFKDNLWPMHLCNWAAIIGFFALRTRKPLLVELLYFWGLAATLQGLITPNLNKAFPHPHFFVFFHLHSFVVIAALYAVFGRKQTPRPGAVLRTWLWANVYFVTTLIVNWITHSNYGFLREKPDGASLLDHLGEWPYYLIALEALALVFFFLLNLPFLKGQFRAKAEAGSMEKAAADSGETS